MSENITWFSFEENIWENVAKTFNTSVKSLDEDVEVLKQWLKTQKHLPNMLDSKALRNFLILNKCSIENTKQKIDNYYTVRSKIKDIYNEINPKLPYYKESNELVFIVGLPELTDEMYRVCIIKIKSNLANKYHDHTNTVKNLINMQELRLREDVMFGEIHILDCEGMSPSFILKLTPILLYKAVILIYQQVFSLRVKALYIINMPLIGRKVLNQVKNMLKPKSFERIHILPDAESLKTVIPLRMLPKNYGGEGHSLELLQNAVDEEFRKNQSLFDDLDEMKIDENLRAETMSHDEWGVYGNFKKLDID